MSQLRCLTLALLCLSAVLGAQDLAEVKKARADGEHSRAVALLQQDIKAVLDNPAALALLVDSLTQIEEYDSAVGYSMTLVKNAPDEAEHHKLATRAFYMRAEESKTDPGATSAKVEGFYEGALRYARSGAKLAPKDAEFASYEGHCLYWLNRGQESAQAFERAFELDPQNGDYLYFAARSWLVANEAQRAQDAAERACKANPGKAYLHTQRGEICARRQDWQGATDGFSKAFEVGGGSDDGGRAIANAIWPALGANKRMGEAVRVMDAWCEAHPRVPLAWLYAGWYKAQAGQREEALEAYSRSFEVSGKKNGGAAVEAAMLLAALGRYEEAAQWMVKAHKSGFDFGDVKQSPKHRLQGIFAPLVNARRFEEAVKLLERYGAQMDREYWGLNNALGFLYRDWGESRGGARSSEGRKLCNRSVAYYEKALKSVNKPEYGATATEIAMVHNDLGLMLHYPRYGNVNRDRAIALYRKAIEYDPQYKDALENLGLCLLDAGKFEEAKTLFERVLELEPGRRVSTMGKRRAERGMSGGR